MSKRIIDVLVAGSYHFSRDTLHCFYRLHFAGNVHHFDNGGRLIRSRINSDQVSQT